MHPLVLAALAPIVGGIAYGAARWIGRWFRRAVTESACDAIREVVAPDIKAMGDSLGHSIDQLRDESRTDHQRVTGRLDHLSERVDALETTVTRHLNQGD